MASVCCTAPAFDSNTLVFLTADKWYAFTVQIGRMFVKNNSFGVT
jgi:hypothetical protein